MQNWGEGNEAGAAPCLSPLLFLEKQRKAVPHPIIMGRRPARMRRTLPVLFLGLPLSLLCEAFISAATAERRTGSNRLLDGAASLLSSSTDDDATSGVAVAVRELTNVKRILCLSDLHTDHADNFRWLEGHLGGASDASPREDDLLVVAGDVSHDLGATFAATLRLLRSHCQVFFVPGNHEAWLEHGSCGDSLAKLDRVYAVCRDLGVHVDPLRVRAEKQGGGGEGSGDVWIVPMQSWYDGSLGTCLDEFSEGFEHWPWMDFVKCKWPADRFPPSEDPSTARIPTGLVEHFHRRNEAVVRHVRERLSSSPEAEAATAGVVLTVSHFLPNARTLPDWKDPSRNGFDAGGWLDHGAAGMSAKFAKVAGCAALDGQIRSLLLGGGGAATLRHVHVFGHSHRPKDFTWENVRYVHHPLGKPRERELRMIDPDVGFRTLWREGREVEGPVVTRYWEQYGGGKEKLWERMERVRPGRHRRLRKQQQQQRQQENERLKEERELGQEEATETTNRRDRAS